MSLARQIIFPVIQFSVVLLIGVVQAQDSCIGLPTDSVLASELRNEVIAGGGALSGITVRGGPYYTCQAQGNSNGTYRFVSVIMEYTSGSSMRVGQFEVWCISSEWNSVTNSFQVLFDQGATYDGSISLRTDCSSCNFNAGNDQHCVACDAACNDGLMRCTGSATDDCCVAFEDDGVCSKDTECDDTNFVASQQNNFFCSCDFASCDPGYSIGITNSSGCYCVLSNICMTQPSPCNDGSCTLNSPPDNFTCNCTGTGYTGDTCNEGRYKSNSLSNTAIATNEALVPTESQLTTGTVISTSGRGSSLNVLTNIATQSVTLSLNNANTFSNTSIGVISGLSVLVMLLLLAISVSVFIHIKNIKRSRTATSDKASITENHNKGLTIENRNKGLTTENLNKGLTTENHNKGLTTENHIKASTTENRNSVYAECVDYEEGNPHHYNDSSTADPMPIENIAYGNATNIYS